MVPEVDGAQEKLIPDFFVFNTGAFEGPVKLLYDLIKKERLDICDIAITDVVRQFVDYLDSGKWELDEAVSFVSYVSLLMLLKSRALFPPEEDEGEEGLSEEEEFLLLQELLAERQIFTNLSLWLEQRLNQESRFYGREMPPPEFFRQGIDSIGPVSPELLAQLATELTRKPQNPIVQLEHMVGGEVSVEERIEWILSKLPGTVRSKSTFRKMISEVTNKLERIVTLLALLELYRLGRVDLRQAKVFGDIEIVALEDKSLPSVISHR